MPNCFQLFKKTEPEKAVILQDVDADICEHFKVPCDKVHWYHGWYDTIGFYIAIGKDWDWLVNDTTNDLRKAEEALDPDGIEYHQRKLDIINYLQANYNYSAFYSHK